MNFTIYNDTREVHLSNLTFGDAFMLVDERYVFIGTVDLCYVCINEKESRISKLYINHLVIPCGKVKTINF